MYWLRGVETGAMRRRPRVGGALTAAVALAGCTGVTGGQGVPVRQPDTAVTTTPSPALVSAEAIADKRLKRSELASVVGDSDLRQVQSYTAPYDSSEGVEPRECAYTLLFQETLAYLGALATVGDGNRGTRGQAVSQLITVFDDREQSARVVADAPGVWERCPAGAPFSTTVGAVTQHWVRGQTTFGPDRAATTVERQEAPPRRCGHVVASRANVAVEAIVCGDGDSAKQADDVVTRIMAALPR